jgi:hypothetical protein
MSWILSTSKRLGHPQGFSDKDYNYVHNPEKSAYGKNTLIGWNEVSLSKEEVADAIIDKAFSSAIFKKKVHKQGQKPYTKREDASVYIIGNTVWFDIDGGDFNPNEFYDNFNGDIDFVMTYGQSSPLGKTSFRVIVKTPIVFSDDAITEPDDLEMRPIADYERYYAGVAKFIFGDDYSNHFDNFQGELSRFSAPLRNPHLDYSKCNQVWLSDMPDTELLAFNDVAVGANELVTIRGHSGKKLTGATVKYTKEFKKYITKETDDVIFVSADIPIPYGENTCLTVEELYDALEDGERISIGSIFQNTESLPFHTIGYGFAYLSNREDKSLLMECRSSTNKVAGLSRSKLVIVEKPIEILDIEFCDDSNMLIESFSIGETYSYEGKAFIATGSGSKYWYFAVDGIYVRYGIEKTFKAKIEASDYDDIFFDLNTGKYNLIKGATVFKHSKNIAVDIINKDILNDADRLKSKYNPLTQKRRFQDPEDGLPCYNTFRPSKFITEPIEATEHESIIILLNHLFANQDELKDKFIKALAFHLQTSEAIHLAWIFLGIEGAGKGVLMDFIFKLFGHHNSTKRKLNDFTGDIVKGVPDKQICFIDENLPESKSAEVVENLKGIIGNKTYSSRAMRTDAVQVDNFTMYFLAANDYGLKLSENDRRMDIVDCSTKLSEVVPDLDSFVRELMSDGVVQSFSDYLMSLEVKLSDVRTVTQSEFRNRTIETRLTIEQLVAKCILNNTLKPIDELLDDDFESNYKEVLEFLNSLHGSIKTFGYIPSAKIKEIADDIVALTYVSDSDFAFHTCRNYLSKIWGKPELKKINGKATRCYIIGDKL